MDDVRVVRFWSKVDQSAGPTGCWPWQGSRTPNGYGRHAAGWTSYAHRVAYRYTFGPFALDLDVLHRCDNPPCCNPAHLFLGTARDNLRDASAKGRTARRTGEDSPRHKLTWEQVHAIRRRLGDGAPTRTLAREYGVSQVTIVHIGTGRTWKSD